MDLSEVFGANVKTLREALKISQSELSARSSITRSYLCAIEQGKANPSLLVIQRVAGALGVSPTQLLRTTTPQESPPLLNDLPLRVMRLLIQEGYEGEALHREFRRTYPVARRFHA